jgi:hypothetical protein
MKLSLTTLCTMTPQMETLDITKRGIMKLGMMTLNIMTLSIMAIGIMT